MVANRPSFKFDWATANVTIDFAPVLLKPAIELPLTLAQSINSRNEFTATECSSLNSCRPHHQAPSDRRHISQLRAPISKCNSRSQRPFTLSPPIDVRPAERKLAVAGFRRRPSIRRLVLSTWHEPAVAAFVLLVLVRIPVRVRWPFWPLAANVCRRLKRPAEFTRPHQAVFSRRTNNQRLELADAGNRRRAEIIFILTLFVTLFLPSPEAQALPSRPRPWRNLLSSNLSVNSRRPLEIIMSPTKSWAPERPLCVCFQFGPHESHEMGTSR